HATVTVTYQEAPGFGPSARDRAKSAAAVMRLVGLWMCGSRRKSSGSMPLRVFGYRHIRVQGFCFKKFAALAAHRHEHLESGIRRNLRLCGFRAKINIILLVVNCVCAIL